MYVVCTLKFHFHSKWIVNVVRILTTNFSDLAARNRIRVFAKINIAHFLSDCIACFAAVGLGELLTVVVTEPSTLTTVVLRIFGAVVLINACTVATATVVWFSCTADIEIPTVTTFSFWEIETILFAYP